MNHKEAICNVIAALEQITNLHEQIKEIDSQFLIELTNDYEICDGYSQRERLLNFPEDVDCQEVLNNYVRLKSLMIKLNLESCKNLLKEYETWIYELYSEDEEFVPFCCDMENMTENGLDKLMIRIADELEKPLPQAVHNLLYTISKVAELMFRQKNGKHYISSFNGIFASEEWLEYEHPKDILWIRGYNIKYPETFSSKNGELFSGNLYIML